MKIAATLPDHGAIVEAILEGFTVAAMLIIQTGVVPPFPTQLPIRYRRETGETWLLPNQVVQVGEADCEDLCIWFAAGLRVTGQDPGAMCTLVNTGPRQIHCLVRMSDGQLYDPSLELRQRETAQKRALKTMAVSGWDVGGQVQVTDHRKPPGSPRKPSEGLPPPAAAPVGPLQQATFGPGAFSDKDKTATRTNPDGSVTRWYQPGGALNPKPDDRYDRAVTANRPGNIAIAMAAKAYAESIGDKPTADLEKYGRLTRQLNPNLPVADPLALDPLDPAYEPYGPGYNPYFDPYGGYGGGFGGMFGGDTYGNDEYVQQYLMQQTQPAFYDMPVTYEDIYGLETEQWEDSAESEMGDFIDVEGDIS